jgi:twitching motility two-component system response regulator PilH
VITPPDLSAKRRVLVVDPDAATRTRVVAVLNTIAQARGESIGIDEAGNGTAALALWSERRHRIVVAEIVLEGTSGLALLRRIRSEVPATDTGMAGPTVALGRRAVPPSAGATWVVIVSQMARDSDRYWGLRQGANAYFGKPFADDALANALGRAFEEAAAIES